MKHKIMLILITLILIKLVLADTHIPYGDVSGTWYLEGSPYIPDGVITVPVDSVLIIEPGVEIIFELYGRLNVRGALFCEGTVADSIRFRQPYLQSQQDGALRFVDTRINLQDSSFVSYCSFDSVGVICEEVNSLIISNSTIKNGTGVELIDSNPILDNLLIYGNSDDDFGGGIRCDNSSPHITNTEITNNSSSSGCGGGISFRNGSNSTLYNTLIHSNNSNIGGGIYCENSFLIVNTSILSNNSSYCSGGGAAVYAYYDPNVDDTEISFFDCEIIGNNSGQRGSAICLYGAHLIVEDTLIQNNSAEEEGTICSFGSSNTILTRTNILDNSVGLTGGAIHKDTGGLYYSQMVITNCLIARNSALEIGAISAYTEKLVLTNVTITDNVVAEDSFIGGIILELGADLYVNNSIIYGNQGVEIASWGENDIEVVYSNIEVSDPSVFGIGTISEDPLFADEEYHLSDDSPCIDSGTPNYHFNDIEDPLNPGFALYPAMGTLRSDMGAYGGNGYSGYHVDAEEIEIPAVSDIQLSNFPNPFNPSGAGRGPSTEISFQISEFSQQNVEVEIYNIKGQHIVTLNDPSKTECIEGRQTYSVTWNGTDQSGNPVASGIYFYKLNLENSPIKKMILLK